MTKDKDELIRGLVRVILILAGIVAAGAGGGLVVQQTTPPPPTEPAEVVFRSDTPIKAEIVGEVKAEFPPSQTDLMKLNAQVVPKLDEFKAVFERFVNSYEQDRREERARYEQVAQTLGLLNQDIRLNSRTLETYGGSIAELRSYIFGEMDKRLRAVERSSTIPWVEGQP